MDQHQQQLQQQPGQQHLRPEQQQQWQHFNTGQNEMRLPAQHPEQAQSSGHLETGAWRGQNDDAGQRASGLAPPHAPPPPSEMNFGRLQPQQGHHQQQGWGQDHSNHIESGPPGVPHQQEPWPQEEEPQPPGSGPEPGAPGEPPPPGHFYGMPHSNLAHEQAPAGPPPPPPPPPPGEPQGWDRPPPPPDSSMHGAHPPPPPPEHQSLPTPVQLPVPIQLPPPQTLPAPHPLPPPTLPAPLPPGQQQQPQPPAALPPPQGQEGGMPQQGELSQLQYNALTPEQQAEYWNQWHQNYSQYYNLQQQQQPVYPGYEGYVDPQYQLYQQQQYQQYGVPQPGWEQYAQQSAYQQQMPPEAYMQPQQGYAHPQGQMPYGQMMPPQPAGPMAPFASMAQQGLPGAGFPGPGQASSHGMEPRAPGAPLFPTGLAVPMPAQPKKPAVPEWLRAEMLKRGLSADDAGAPKKQLSDSDEESEPAAKQRRKFTDAGPGTRWQGPAAGRGRAGSDESDSEAEEEARMMRINNEVKRQLTQLLLAVTDRMFEEVAEEVYTVATAPVKRPVPVSGAVVVMREEGSDGPSGDVLGLGYGSDSDEDEESKPDAAPSAATGGKGVEVAGAKSDDPPQLSGAATAAVKQEGSPTEKGKPSEGAVDTSIKPEPKSEGVSSEPSFPKGCRVWYIDRGGSRIPATVEAVDTSHPPPSYTIRLDGAPQTRETEGERLRLMEDSDAGADVKQEQDGGPGLALKSADPRLEPRPPEAGAGGLGEKSGTSKQGTESAEKEQGAPVIKDEAGKGKAAGMDDKGRGVKKEERDKPKDGDRASLKRKESDRDGGKDMGRDKEKEKQRAKEKERAREKEKEKEKERQREKAKEREREERERERARHRDRDRRRKRGSSSSPSQSPSRSAERELDRRDSKRGRYGRSRSRSRGRRSRSLSRPRRRRASPKPVRRSRSRSESPPRRKGTGRSPSPASSSPPKKGGRSKGGKDSKSSKKDSQKSKK